MKKVICFLVVTLILQISFDETLSHFDVNGHVDLKGNSALAIVNHHLQKGHDHLWVYSDISYLITRRDLYSVPAFLSVHLILPDIICSIWQPPKCNLVLVN